MCLNMRNQNERKMVSAGSFKIFVDEEWSEY